MADYNAGIARAVYELDTAKAEQSLARTTKSTLEYEAILKRVVALGKGGLPGGGAGPGAKLPGLPSGGAGLGGAANDATLAERATLRYATSLATAQKAQGDLHGAVDTYRAALRDLTPNTIEAHQATARLARAESDLARGGAGAQLLAGLKSGFLNIVGPAALATAGIALVRGTVESFVAAFKFKAELDQTNAAITTLLKGVRDSGVVFDGARQFADKYKLTQKETSEAISESIPVIRASKAPIEDILGVFTRLTILKPGKTFADASRAISELQAGQTVSLEKIFNVPISKANALKKEIEGGADAIGVLSRFLTESGVGMDALAIRSQGAAGALKDAAIAQEQLTLAQGKLAQSAGGIFFVEALTRQYRGLANLLNGDALAALKGSGDELRASAAGALAYTLAIAQGKSAVDAQIAGNLAAAAATDQLTNAHRNGGGGAFEFAGSLGAVSTALSKDAADKLESQIATAKLGEEQAQLEADSRLAAQGLLGAGDQALILANKYGIASDQAQFLINQQKKLFNADALADQRAGERSPNTNPFANTEQTAAQQEKFAKLRRDREKEDADKAEQNAKAIADSRARLEESQAVTTAQKIALFQRRLAKATNEADRNDLKAKINDLQATSERAATRAGAKGLSADTRADLRLLSDKQDRLKEVNRLLAEGHLTELARKQLLIEQADLEKQIGDEIDKQNQAKVDAQLDTVRDAQSRLKEAKEAAGLTRALAGGRLSGAQQNAATLRLQEIQLEQQKRALDIDREIKASGGTPQGPLAPQQPLTGGAATPLGIGTPGALGVPLGPIGGLATAQVVVNLAVTIDGTTGTVTKSNVDPNTILNLLSGNAAGRNLSGGG